jgi:hypothetical protein
VLILKIGVLERKTNEMKHIKEYAQLFVDLVVEQVVLKVEIGRELELIAAERELYEIDKRVLVFERSLEQARLFEVEPLRVLQNKIDQIQIVAQVGFVGLLHLFAKLIHVSGKFFGYFVHPVHINRLSQNQKAFL